MGDGLRILICGGRDFDRTRAFNVLERDLRDEIADRLGLHVFSVAVIIHGDARGADQGAADWGRSEHAQVIAFPADWKKHGKAAGPIRNRRMLEEGRPDVVVALPGGRGTENMVSQAIGADIPVVRLNADASVPA